MPNSPVLAFDSSQAAARDAVRTMMHVTGWSASRLAVKAGLAASTLNRFMHKDVKHVLKFSTMSMLLITALARLNQRLVTDETTNLADVEAVIPMISQFGIDIEAEADRLLRTKADDDFWRLDAVKNAMMSLSGDLPRQPVRYDLGRSMPPNQSADQNKSPGVPTAAAKRGYDLPVLGAAKGGDNAFFFDNGEVHEHVRRPPNLEGVDNGFAIYMVGDSMEPRYFAGEFLFVNPNRPATRNCFVVVEIIDGQGLVKQFIRHDAEHLHLRQFSPEKDIKIDNGRVKSVQRIVGTGEP